MSLPRLLVCLLVAAAPPTSAPGKRAPLRDGWTTVPVALRFGESLADLAERYGTTARRLRLDNGWRAGHEPASLTIVRVTTRASLIDPPRPASCSGQSRGRPGSGSLVGGVQLVDGPFIEVRDSNDAWLACNAAWAIDVAARRLRRTTLGAVGPVYVGCGSQQGVCPLHGHETHCSGRDVDLGLFYRRADGHVHARIVVPSSSSFDVSANLAFVEGLASTGEVTWILLAERWIQRLEAAGLSGPARALLSAHEGHDHHFHVRFRCPPGDSACRG